MDIANMVLFLCSEKAGFITGENICIDGGMTKQMIYHGDCGWRFDEWKQKSYEKAKIKNLTVKNAEIVQKQHIIIDWKIFICRDQIWLVEKNDVLSGRYYPDFIKT